MLKDGNYFVISIGDVAACRVCVCVCVCVCVYVVFLAGRLGSFNIHFRLIQHITVHSLVCNNQLNILCQGITSLTSELSLTKIFHRPIYVHIIIQDFQNHKCLGGFNLKPCLYSYVQVFHFMYLPLDQLCSLPLWEYCSSVCCIYILLQQINLHSIKRSQVRS
jgi:hypothetical protein